MWKCVAVGYVHFPDYCIDTQKIHWSVLQTVRFGVIYRIVWGLSPLTTVLLGPSLTLVWDKAQGLEKHA